MHGCKNELLVKSSVGEVAVGEVTVGKVSVGKVNATHLCTS